MSRYEAQLRGQYAQARAQDAEDIWALRNAFKEEERLLHDALRVVSIPSPFFFSFFSFLFLNRNLLYFSIENGGAQKQRK
jgi:hypothetical protein